MDRDFVEKIFGPPYYTWKPLACRLPCSISLNSTASLFHFSFIVHHLFYQLHLRRIRTKLRIKQTDIKQQIFSFVLMQTNLWQTNKRNFLVLSFLKRTRSIGLTSHAIGKCWLLVCLFSWLLSHLSQNTIHWNRHFRHLFGDIRLFPRNTDIFAETQKRRGKHRNYC